MARPSKWEEIKEKLVLIEGWARDGLTDEQIYPKLGIASSTWFDYKAKYTELREILKKGREIADYEVENAMFKSALGFHYTEEELTKTGEKVTVRKYQPPSNTAQIFWLKNRKPSVWRDRQEVDHSGSMEINNPLKDINTDDLLKLAKLADKDG